MTKSDDMKRTRDIKLKFLQKQLAFRIIFTTSSVQRKGADYAARALKNMIQGLGQIFQLFLKIWVMKVIAESMVKKLFVHFLGGKIGF